MRKTKILGALLAGVMAVSGISVIPGVSSPFVVEAEAASKLAAPTGLKATVSGIYIMDVKAIRGKLEAPPQKKKWYQRFKKS